jgi:hypothetical protein
MPIIVGVLELVGLALVVVGLLVGLGWVGLWIVAGVALVAGAQVLDRYEVGL